MTTLPAHTYPSSTLYLSRYPPPDDLRLEPLGRPITSFGPRSFLPSPADRIKHIVPLRPATSRLELLPDRIDRRNYLVQPSTFDIRAGRGKNVVVPLTMTSGLALPTYRTPTPCVVPNRGVPLRAWRTPGSYGKEQMTIMHY
jgi:hypothetical protein